MSATGRFALMPVTRIHPPHPEQTPRADRSDRLRPYRPLDRAAGRLASGSGGLTHVIPDECDRGGERSSLPAHPPAAINRNPGGLFPFVQDSWVSLGAPSRHVPSDRFHHGPDPPRAGRHGDTVTGLRLGTPATRGL